MCDYHLEMLSLSQDQQNPSCIQFDDSNWQLHLTSLKPLGLNVLLNLCNASVTERLCRFSDHLCNIALQESHSAVLPVHVPWGLCELARLIGALGAGLRQEPRQLLPPPPEPGAARQCFLVWGNNQGRGERGKEPAQPHGGSLPAREGGAGAPRHPELSSLPPQASLLGPRSSSSRGTTLRSTASPVPRW